MPSMHPPHLLNSLNPSYNLFMDILQQLFRSFVPHKIKCIEQAQLQQEARQFEQFQQHPNFSLQNPKVPAFQHLFDPIRTVTWHNDYIKGFRFQINLPLSPYFQLTHTWNIPSSTDAPSNNPMKPPKHPTYSLSAQVVKDIQNREPVTIMTARMDNDGKLDAFFVKKLARNVSLRLSSSFMNSNVELGMLSADIDIENRNNTTGFKLVQGLFNFSHMERITRNLILGFDYTYRNRQGMSLFGYAAKYKHRSHHLFLQYLANQQMLNLAYSVPIKKGTMFISSFTHEKQQNKTTSVLGIKQKYPNSEIVATINSRGKVATSLSLLGGPEAPYSLRLCSIVDYIKETYKFGYGITIGQAE